MSSDALYKNLFQQLNRAQPSTVAKGRGSQDAVLSLAFSEKEGKHRVQAEVQDDKLYRVELGESKRADSCNCIPFMRLETPCKHMVAVALRAIADLKSTQNSGASAQRTRLAAVSTISAAPSLSTPRLLYELESMAQQISQDKALATEDLYYQLYLEPSPSTHWALVPVLATAADETLQNVQKLSFAALRNTRTVALGSQDKALLGLFPPTFNTYATDPETPRSLVLALNVLRESNRLRDASTLRAITIAAGLWAPRLALAQEEQGRSVLHAVLRQGPAQQALRGPAHIFGSQEKALYHEHALYLLDSTGWTDAQLSLLAHPHPLDPSETTAAALALHALGDLAELPEALRPLEEQGIPQPRLQLHFDSHDKALQVAFGFAYPGTTDLLRHAPQGGVLRSRTADNQPLLLRRDPVLEAAYLDELDALMQNQTWSAFVRRQPLQLPLPHIPHFIRQVVEPLRARPHWVLEGLNALARFQKRTGKVNLKIHSGVDWFDLQGEVQFGDISTPLSQLLALAPGQDEITLADGSQGILPRQLAQLLRIVQGLQGKVDKKQDQPLRISALHQAVLTPLLDNPLFHIEQREQLCANLAERALKPLAVQPPPASLQATLRPYQQEGLDWLRQMRAWGTGGILADDMGLGKTVQVIAALCDFYENPDETRPTLIVLPTSLLHNWKHELARFAPHLSYRIHHGQERETLDVAHCQRTLILTSYAILRNEIDFWNACPFGYVILDESQAIKNPLSQAAACARTLQAAHRLALTCTPIENNLMDLWSQFAFLNPGLLGSAEFFKKEFVNAASEDPGNATSLDLLSRLTAPFYLRRTKEKVLLELPPLEERVLYVDMDAAQRKLYDKTKELYRQKILGTIESQGIRKSQIHIIEGMLRLRQIACDPRLYEPKSKAPSAKLDLLLEKLREDVVEHHKALVFSQFTTLLDYCGQALKSAGIDYAYLDGATRNREQAIEEFTAHSNKRVFLISLKAGGTGLNLTCADYVFHLDPWWNPAVEAQATGRAYRMGQKNAVQSIKLVASGTIEEKILQLQENKRQLASAVLQSDHCFLKSLDADLVKELFS
jgi:superfamily II DNA or RNA helicase